MHAQRVDHQVFDPLVLSLEGEGYVSTVNEIEALACPGCTRTESLQLRVLPSTTTFSSHSLLKLKQRRLQCLERQDKV